MDDLKKEEPTLPYDIEFRDSKGKVRQAPCLDASVADTHAHLDMLPSPGLALARCAFHGVDFVVSVIDPSESTKAYDYLDDWRIEGRELLHRWGLEGKKTESGDSAAGLSVPHTRFLVGVHPHNAKDYTPEVAAKLKVLAADGQVSGIGEIGLDYHYDLSPHATQRDVFARQIELAHAYGLPISLHLREAHDEGIEILKREGVPEAGCVLHCFNLDSEALRPFLALGCYIAFGGPLTFKKSDYVREAATKVPLNRLLTETDAPYMTPEPCRGTTCGPEHVIFTAEMLFTAYNETHPEYADKSAFLDSIYENALRVFDKER